ncbi:MAG: uracil-DNA glycosylase [Candidatus Omnitrophica bacterium]|nr:uracil-DNA glycosylase [Candidatus Omnitrophota bacterium]
MGNKNAAEISELITVIDGLKNLLQVEQFFLNDFFLQKNQPETKEEQVRQLFEQALACKQCCLYKTRTNLVFGDGNLNAELVFVGEAPGRDEDLAGKPFVGAAGELLAKIIAAMGMSREKVYITNVLRCRPPNNRNPLPDEVACCQGYLLKLLEIIKPKAICTLGKFASGTLLNDSRPISSLRGKFYDYAGAKLMPTFHPAYLLRNPEDKKIVWADIKKIMSYLKNEGP